MLEILLNNNALELEKQEFILNFTVMSFESPEKVGGYYSSTLKAKATPKNRLAFGYADVLGVLNSVPYQTFSCVARLYGQTLDVDTKLILQSFDGKYFNFNIFFNLSSFANALGEKMLNELDLGTTLYQVSNFNFDDLDLDYLNPYYYKSGDTFTNWWYQRYYTWKLKRILSEVIDASGYTVVGGLPDTLDWLNDTYLLPTNEKLSFEKEHEQNKKDFEGFARLTSDRLLNDGSHEIEQIFSWDTADTSKGIYTNRVQLSTDDYVHLLRFEIEIERVSGALQIVQVQFGYATNTLDVLNTFVPLHGAVALAGTASEPNMKKAFTIGVASDSLINDRNIYIRIIASTEHPTSDVDVKIKANSYLQTKIGSYIPEGTTTVVHGQDLPEVKQKDFLKNILYLSGLVLKIDNYNKTIKYVKIQDVINNTEYLDWTSKIDFSEDISQVYNPDGIAQSNIIKFKDTLEGNYSFSVSNPNLETSKENSLIIRRCNVEPVFDTFALTDLKKYAQTTLVKPSDASESISISNTNIPAYHTDYDNKKLDITFGVVADDFPFSLGYAYAPFNQNVREIDGESVNNPILNFANVASAKIMKSFNDLSTLATNFAYTQNVYENFRKVQMRAKLNMIDLLSLDVEKPIFLGANINRRFLLLSISGWSSPEKNCTIELLMINETI